MSDAVPVVDFDTTPEQYRHWTLATDGDVATLTLAVDEDGGLVPGYELKANSYDLGVDIELYDAIQRVRFEHPGVKAVVITGGLEKMFCAGANIRMLAPAQNIFSRPPVITIALTPGCSKRTRWIASYSSMSTPRS